MCHTSPRDMLCKEKPPQWEGHAPQRRVAPLAATGAELVQQRGTSTAKTKSIKLFFLKRIWVLVSKWGYIFIEVTNPNPALHASGCSEIITKYYHNWAPSIGKWASHVVPVVKNLPANSGDTGNVGSMPGSGRSPGGGHGDPLQYYCLENSVDRRARQVMLHRITKSRHDWSYLASMHACIGK